MYSHRKHFIIIYIIDQKIDAKMKNWSLNIEFDRISTIYNAKLK